MFKRRKPLTVWTVAGWDEEPRAVFGSYGKAMRFAMMQDDFERRELNEDGTGAECYPFISRPYQVNEAQATKPVVGQFEFGAAFSARSSFVRRRRHDRLMLAFDGDLDWLPNDRGGEKAADRGRASAGHLPQLWRSPPRGAGGVGAAS